MKFRKYGTPWRPVTVRNTGISPANQGRYPLRDDGVRSRVQIREALERVRRPVSPVAHGRLLQTVRAPDAELGGAENALTMPRNS